MLAADWTEAGVEHGEALIERPQVVFVLFDLRLKSAERGTIVGAVQGLQLTLQFGRALR